MTERTPELVMDEAPRRGTDRSDHPYRHLPEPIPLASMTSGQPASPPQDLDGGRDVAQDAALRAGG